MSIEKNRHTWTKTPVYNAPRIPVNFEGPTVIDLFCGAGGLSLGMEEAGFMPLLAVDINEQSLETYRRNHPFTHTILGDMRKLTETDIPFSDILEEEYSSETLSEIHSRIGNPDVDLITAGIPCQGFSLSNKKQDDDDERNYLFQEFIKAVQTFTPNAVLIENVSSMQAAKDGAFVSDICSCLETLGYTVDYTVLSADEYGVPQKRERLFFIGYKTDEETEIDINFPSPIDDSVTVEDAISDLAQLQSGETKRTYAHSPENTFQEDMRRETSGTSVSNHSAPNHQSQTIERIKETDPGDPMYERFTQRVRLPKDDQSPTIVSGGIRPQFQFGHPFENRGLTVRERARLQSFPDWYTFTGGVTQGRVQTGMAVPPKLAEALGNEIYRTLKRNY